MAGQVSYHAMSSMLPGDLAKVSLPVQREYADAQLHLAKVLLLILETHADEEKVAHDQEKSKGHVQKVKTAGDDSKGLAHRVILPS